MKTITIELIETDYQRLTSTARSIGKPVHVLFHEWITQLPDIDSSIDVTKDPVFQMEGYESEAPPDLSSSIDKYLYKDSYPK